MTTGNSSIGSQSQIGAFASKSWSGADYPKATSGTNKTPRSALLDASGNILDTRYASNDDISKAIIRAKAARIKRGYTKRVPVPHTYQMSSLKGFMPGIQNKPGNTPRPFSYYFGAMGVSSLWTPNDDISLLNKLRPALQGSDFNIGVFLAEAPMAIQMIGDSALRLGGALRAFRRGNIQQARRELLSGNEYPPGTRKKVASANWLELQYGWLPLVSDMESGAQFLAHKISGKPIKRVRVSHRIDAKLSSSIPSLYGPDSSSWGYTRKSIIAYIEEVDQVKLSGLTDVASIVWEKMPYSFVADWAIPIGNYLSARNTVGAIKATYVTTTVTEGYVKPDRDVIDGYFGCKSYWKYEASVKREVSTNWSPPKPNFKPLEKIASWKHAANAVALLIQSKS